MNSERNPYDDMQVELDRLQADLSDAEAELIRLQARISGLRAQRDTFAAALAAARSTTSPAAEAPVQLQAIKNRTDAITTLLRHAGHAMSIEEVQAALDDGWRDKSTYAVVASTLNMLERTGRITKVARGRYAAA